LCRPRFRYFAAIIAGVPSNGAHCLQKIEQVLVMAASKG
jgi:hypothetical protein